VFTLEAWWNRVHDPGSGIGTDPASDVRLKRQTALATVNEPPAVPRSRAGCPPSIADCAALVTRDEKCTNSRNFNAFDNLKRRHETPAPELLPPTASDSLFGDLKKTQSGNGTGNVVEFAGIDQR
jgi:hypothetical protein